MAKKHVKKVWKDFEVVKVKLNPEQAVLSCCDLDRQITGGGTQCITVTCAPGLTEGTASS